VHSIKTNDSTTIRSNDLAPGTSFTFKKDTTGVFNYHCSQHPTVQGTFILTP
jgi:plastocyanin